MSTLSSPSHRLVVVVVVDVVVVVAAALVFVVNNPPKKNAEFKSLTMAIGKYELICTTLMKDLSEWRRLFSFYFVKFLIDG
jgi:nitrate/nitrite transporter NarK